MQSNRSDRRQTMRKCKKPQAQRSARLVDVRALAIVETFHDSRPVSLHTLSPCITGSKTCQPSSGNLYHYVDKPFRSKRNDCVSVCSSSIEMIISTYSFSSGMTSFSRTRVQKRTINLLLYLISNTLPSSSWWLYNF